MCIFILQKNDFIVVCIYNQNQISDYKCDKGKGEGARSKSKTLWEIQFFIALWTDKGFVK